MTNGRCFREVRVGQYRVEQCRARARRVASSAHATIAGWAWRGLHLIATLAISALLVFLVELIARGSLEQTLLFFQQPFRRVDDGAALRAAHRLHRRLSRTRYQALFIIAPIALTLAFVGHQKSLYLGDPLYPADFLYVRQIVELMPLLVAQRPWDAAAMVVGGLLAIGLFIYAWRSFHRRANR